MEKKGILLLASLDQQNDLICMQSRGKVKEKIREKEEILGVRRKEKDEGD